MNLVKNRKLYFGISIALMIPGIFFILFSGLKPSIEFTGGSRLDVTYSGGVDTGKIGEISKKIKINFHSVRKIDQDSYSIRTSPIDLTQKNTFLSEIQKNYKGLKEESFETVGPTIGSETQLNALKSVVIASLAITFFIAIAFRKVSKPVASWKYGIAAVIALLHDVIIVVGLFAFLGYFFSVEVDSLFITALLTVMGFSVHDTIVVFDRIRENLTRNFDKSFEEVVNDSMLETLNRSLNTSLTVLIVLFALLLFGGESIRWFVLALLVGMISGTYSSIFTASQIIVTWYEWDKKRKLKKSK